MKDTRRRGRVTLSLHRDILASLDKATKRLRASRSSVVESILEEWHEEGLRKQLSREASEHYKSLTKEEKAADTSISKFGTRTPQRVWTEGE